MKRLERMTKQELLELLAAVQARLAELEAQAQEAQAEARYEAASGPAGEARAKGHIEWKKVNGCGPYAYLRWWEGGKLKSKYLGKNPDGGQR